MRVRIALVAALVVVAVPLVNHSAAAKPKPKGPGAHPWAERSATRAATSARAAAALPSR